MLLSMKSGGRRWPLTRNPLGMLPFPFRLVPPHATPTPHPLCIPCRMSPWPAELQKLRILLPPTHANPIASFPGRPRVHRPGVGQGSKSSASFLAHNHAGLCPDSEPVEGVHEAKRSRQVGGLFFTRQTRSCNRPK